MSNLLLAKNFTADAALVNNRLVKFGSDAVHIAQAAAATDFIIGVVNEAYAGPQAGDRVDVVRVGIAFVECGAAIPVGSPVTSDNLGRAVVAAPAAGANVRIIGFAEEIGTAAGDVIRVFLAPSVMQG